MNAPESYLMPENLAETTAQRTQKPSCVLLFSGGRDSSLAAICLSEAGLIPILVTVSSGHLVGIEQVHQRLLELAYMMPEGTEWISVNVKYNHTALPPITSKTCLPCQRGYIAVGAIVAKSISAPSIALGYAEYQADFPEQSSLAIKGLKNMLHEHGINLFLPSHSISSKDDAKAALKGCGLSEDSLEQKCQKQIFNIKLSDELLIPEIKNWIDGIDILISNDKIVSINYLDKRILRSSQWSDNA